ncbi:hypothetical protein ACE6ED_23555 [Paenibacillus sp. CN-4]|uniref:hypothetical protein n=1 Tax=Paenibacillus nanchangensis TaxID=3348343 RepID=UPI0039792967
MNNQSKRGMQAVPDTGEKAEKRSGWKARLMAFWKDESGAMGVKQIAATVAVIVIIGAVVVIVNDNLSTWISDVWKLFMEQIEKMTTSG